MRPLLAALLLLSAPAPALAAPPVLGPSLPLPTESVTAEEVKVKSLSGANTAALVVPWVAALPLAATGISITASAPIARGAGDPVTAAAFRASGLSLMGAGLATGVTINSIARGVRIGMGGRWSERIGFFIAGTAAAGAGLGLAAVGSQPGLFADDATSAALLVPGGISWGAGMILLIADAFQTARTNLDLFAACPPRRGPAFAGVSVAPVDGGATATVALTW